MGSVLDQVLLHQAIIGSEAKAAMDMLGEYPDIIIRCAAAARISAGLCPVYGR